jgi:hypothetical protein
LVVNFTWRTNGRSSEQEDGVPLRVLLRVGGQVDEHRERLGQVQSEIHGFAAIVVIQQEGDSRASHPDGMDAAITGGELRDGDERQGGVSPVLDAWRDEFEFSVRVAQVVPAVRLAGGRDDVTGGVLAEFDQGIDCFFDHGGKSLR